MSTAPPPLTGLKVLEFAGLAPGPFAGLLLSDAGASVLRIDRVSPGSSPLLTGDLLTRHKASIAVGLKSSAGVALVRQLAQHADIIIDPFRPGVLEKLGLGPSVLRAANPRLIYGRLTGFRRDGRYATMAGHDINYLSVSGVLSLLGRKGSPPTPPGNILADFAGGGATLFQGILLALLARERTGRGQTVEANMVDGVSYLATFPRFALKTPLGSRPRGENMLDSGCPYYDTYETADGRFMAVGALEPRFYAAFIKGLGLGGQKWEARQFDREHWPEMRKVFEERFNTKSRDAWEAIFDGTDACCTPVLEYAEMEDNPAREGDQRPSVTLKESPCLAVRRDASQPSHGQGLGVEDEGYVGTPLVPGEGGVAVVEQWLKWTEGNEFTVQNGVLVMKEKSKL
ncbi:alpha-methylacyl-CoA racemase [Lasiosphaeria hispida]|uniref:Alpha-methylacyl-CoA racemase n=1 Tax=Lasiosphaeria hispida TaxID=260671 RepID=A0AAJ0HPL2_9PEZI|nr:alpha-methylacyl-CoA racemase [Lasiosphaeria hispida]